MPPATANVLVNARPVVPIWVPGLVMLGATAVTQEKVVAAVRPDASVAVAVIDEVPTPVGVPEMTPPLLMVRPSGRPVAAQVYGALPPVAVTVSVAGLPTLACCAPGLLAVNGRETAHVNVAVPVRAVASLAVIVTDELPTAVGVPEMTPPLLIVSPAGRPLAVQV